jgi:1-deoxy-D-xylulose-5-phosphate reductoisomerase
VVAGALLMDAAKPQRRDAAAHRQRAQRHLPVPAAERSRDGLPEAGVDRILLTASGGPFRDADPATLAAVTPEQACAHPNWSMGRKISVDSATMMNKGLEIIEACWLFDTSPERIQVVVHRQSVIHSMVQYSDGSVLAQLGNPDMRTPIAHALGWPERIDAGVAPLDLFEIARLDFEPPAPDRFPCLRPGLSRRGRGRHGARRAECVQRGRRGRLPRRRIGFTDIARVVEHTMDLAARRNRSISAASSTCWASTRGATARRNNASRAGRIATMIDLVSSVAPSWSRSSCS